LVDTTSKANQSSLTTNQSPTILQLAATRQEHDHFYFKSTASLNQLEYKPAKL